jgi:uncharacterized protein (TIGR03382 family)
MRSVLVLLMVLVVDARRADACSCDLEPHVLAPTPGAAAVPLNARIFMELTQGPHRVVLRGGGQTAVLETATLASYSLGTISLATPPAELQPSTMYEIDVDGVVRGTFVTGTTRDETPPSAAGLLQGVTPEVMAMPSECGSASCNTRSADGDVSRFRFAFEPQSDTALVLVEVYQQGATAKDLVPLREVVDASRCSAHFAHIDPNATYCARAIAYDAAGTRAEGAEVCSTPPMRCATELQSTCSPSLTCTPAESGGCSTSHGTGGWFALALFAVGRGLRRRRMQ